MPIISIANNKGGVAKTTTTLNLADALVRLGKKVLIIDLDTQGSLSIYMGIEPKILGVSIADVLRGECRLMDAMIPLSDNLTLVPATVDLTLREGQGDILKIKLKDYVDKYDYILLDNSPSYGIITVNSFMVSDYVICPCEPEYLAYRGLENLCESIEEVKKHNVKLDFMGVLFTKVQSVRQHKDVMEEIKNNYKTFKAIIKRSVKVSDAVLAQESVLKYAGLGNEISRAYYDFAKEVIEYEKGQFE